MTAPDPVHGPTGTRRIAASATTFLACLLVLFALEAPDRISDLTPAAFARIPIEGLIGAALVLVLPARALPVAAVCAGLALGVLTILKIIDMGFYAVFDRPFDPVLDRSYLASAVDFLIQTRGRLTAIVAVLLAVLLAAGLLVLMVLSVRRLTRGTVRHAAAATRAVAVVSVVWVTCAVLGMPVAASDAATHAYDRVRQVQASLRDEEAFAAESAVDEFRGTPPTDLLTALRGKDVVFAFVESYGRDAVQNPQFAPQVGAALDAGGRALAAAGFGARSAFLTSSTYGGGSWLAHATLFSGLWIDNQQRYRTLVTSDRQTLTGAFRRAGWRTVSVMPATSGSWPEASFFGFDHVYGTEDLGYRGTSFGFGIMPDQYTLSAFQRLELAVPAHPPLLAEIVLTTSHVPWRATPPLLDWNAVGDGAAFAAADDGYLDGIAGADPATARERYRRSVEYSLGAVISFVQAYGDDNLVLVLLGDHQPGPIITGEGASHDVPITVVARDRAVLDRVAGWGWQDGLKPDPQAPVWRMSDFRDRFLATFGG